MTPGMALILMLVVGVLGLGLAAAVGPGADDE